MPDDQVDVTAMLNTSSGTSCFTVSFRAGSRLEDIFAWARSLENESASLIELVFDVAVQQADRRTAFRRQQ